MFRKWRTSSSAARKPPSPKSQPTKSPRQAQSQTSKRIRIFSMSAQSPCKANLREVKRYREIPHESSDDIGTPWTARRSVSPRWQKVSRLYKDVAISYD